MTDLETIIAEFEEKFGFQSPVWVDGLLKGEMQIKLWLRSTLQARDAELEKILCANIERAGYNDIALYGDGTGKWIDQDDVLRVIRRILAHDDVIHIIKGVDNKE